MNDFDNEPTLVYGLDSRWCCEVMHDKNRLIPLALLDLALALALSDPRRATRVVRLAMARSAPFPDISYRIAPVGRILKAW